jgi:hypothetical protein
LHYFFLYLDGLDSLLSVRGSNRSKLPPYCLILKTGECKMHYLISDDLKAIGSGVVTANLDAGEFIYDTMAPDTPIHNVATMRGIAESCKIVIPDNLKNRGDIALKLSHGLSKLNLQRSNKMTKQEEILDLIKAGIEADKSDDSILVDIINSGVPFRQAGVMFKSIMVEQGLRVSSKTRRETVFSMLKKNRFGAKGAPKTFDVVQNQIDAICGRGVEGDENYLAALLSDTTEQQALSLIKKYARDGEFTLPKAPKSATGGSRIKRETHNFMIANPRATEAEFTAFMLESGRSEKIAVRTYEWFGVALKMAAALNAESVVEAPEDEAEAA